MLRLRSDGISAIFISKAQACKKPVYCLFQTFLGHTVRCGKSVLHTLEQDFLLPKKAETQRFSAANFEKC